MATPARALSTALLAAAAGACGPVAPTAPTAGLQLSDWEDLPRGVSDLAHATELAVSGDQVYIANSFSGVLAYRIHADGTLELTDDGNGLASARRCTTVAAHAPSGSLYCGAGDVRGALARLSLADRAHPALDPSSAGDAAVAGATVRDLYADGDALYVATPERGLLRVPIAADGSLGASAGRATVEGTVTGVDGEAGRLAVLVRERGLVGVAVGAQGPAETGALALDGPLLDVAVHGQRAAVALGSRGVVVADLTDAGPVQRFALQPQCVATAVDFDGDRLAVACTSGVLAYDASASPPRVAGFQPSSMVGLDVRFAFGRLLFDDWRVLASYEFNPAGHAVTVDVPNGLVVRPGDGADFAVFNPGDLTLHVGVALRPAGPCDGCERPLGDELVVPPGASADVRVPAERIAAELPSGASGVLALVTSREAAGAPPRGRTAVTLFVQPAGGAATTHRPALGEPFPRMAPGGSDGAPTLPATGRPTRVTFLRADCAMQWPGLADLAWLAAHGMAPGGAAPTVVLIEEPTGFAPSEFMALWGAAPLGGYPLDDYIAGLQGWGQLTPPPDANDVYESQFQALEVPGPDVASEYTLDAAGAVAAFDRIYRGSWTLHGGP